MKSKSDRASPSKAQLLVDIDALIAIIGKARQQCKKKGKNGLVQLALARRNARRLREQIMRLPENSSILIRTTKSVAAIAKWCAELYSLLSFLFNAQYSCTQEESFNYFAARKAGHRKTFRSESVSPELIWPKLNPGSEIPGWSCFAMLQEN